MRLLTVVMSKGVFPCPHCFKAELVVEFINNSKPLFDTIKKKYIENGDSIISEQFRDREVHVPDLLFDDIRIVGASEFMHYLGILNGIEELK